MKPPSQHSSPAPEDLQALRRAIAQLADRCGVDLTQRAALRRVLDSAAPAPFGNGQELQDLAAMLTLLFRLETSSSEDLGITGLRRLWQQLGAMLARFPAGQLSAG